MSPEKDYISAYLDGEMPAEWKNRIERLTTESEELRDTLDRHRAVHEALQSQPGPDFAGVTERSWSIVCRRIAESSGHTIPEVERALNRRRRAVPVWRRRVSVPLPVATAAALAVVFLAAFVLIRLSGINRIDPSEATVAQTMDGLKVTVSAKDVEQLLEILNGQNKVQNVKIEIPVKHQFQMIGQPVLLRASDGFGSFR